MSLLIFRFSKLAIILALVVMAFDFGIGDAIKDRIVDEVLEELPDLGMEDEEPITTSLDDAITEAPFLDDYEPAYFLPMGELPFGPGGYPLLMPGCYEITMESFCLHAGTHGPEGGKGYVLAPLKGPSAPIIKSILDNSRQHPEVEQREIQILIWSILSRAKFSSMADDLQRTASILLTKDQIMELEGASLDVLKKELYSRAYGELPGDVRRVMEAKAELRREFSSGRSNYGDLERIAVLSGAAPFDEDGREIPSGRWSFHPDGYFIRYFPNGYPQTHIQVSMPDICTLIRDDQGRFTGIGDAWGNWLDIDYPGAGVSFTFEGPNASGSPGVITGSWTEMSGSRGGISSWITQHKAEVKAICGKGADIEEVLDIARLAYRVEKVVSGHAGDAALRLVKQAWQDAVCNVAVTGNVGISLGELMAGPILPIAGGPPGVHAVSFGWFQQLPVFDNMANMRRQRERDAEHERIFGDGRQNRVIPEFNPSGGTATPGNRGSQRLAVGGRPKDDDDDDDDDDDEGNNKGPKPSSYGNAQKGMKKFKNGLTGAKAVGGRLAGPGAGAGMSGFAIPMMLSTYMVGKSTSIWDSCNASLGGDPPDPNYDEYAELDVREYEPVQASTLVPQEQADKFNEVLEASMNLTASLRAAIISQDLHGGAIEAGDSEWIYRQAVAIVYYKRLSGVYMYDVADALTAYIEYLESEGIDDMTITAESFEEYQDDVRVNGFSQSEMDSAILAGMTDDEIADSLRDILSADPDEMAGSFFDAIEELSFVLYDVGWDLYSNWDLKKPDDWEADWNTAG